MDPEGERNHPRAVVLTSGGIDSTAALAWAIARGWRPVSIFVWHGQKQVHQEKEAVEAIMGHYRLYYDMENLSDHLYQPAGPNYLIPFRNAALLTVGVALAEREGIKWLGFGGYPQPGWGYEFPDSTPEFLGAFGACIQMGTGGRVRLVCPWSGWTKDQVVRWALDHQVPLELTWTCYAPSHQGKPCGECPACKKRRWAMEVALGETYPLDN